MSLGKTKEIKSAVLTCLLHELPHLLPHGGDVAMQDVSEIILPWP